MPISTLRYEINGRFVDTEGVCDWAIESLRAVHSDMIQADVVHQTNPQTGELAITIEVLRISGRCKHRMKYPASIITPLEPHMSEQKENTPVENDPTNDENYDDSAPGPLDEDSDDEDDLTEFMEDDEEDDVAED